MTNLVRQRGRQPGAVTWSEAEKAWPQGASFKLPKESHPNLRSDLEAAFSWRRTSIRTRRRPRRTSCSRSAPGACVRLAQQRQQAAARHRAQDINDEDQQRERRGEVHGQERHGDNREILHREDECRQSKHDDDQQIDQAHGRLPTSCSTPSSYITARFPSAPRVAKRFPLPRAKRMERGGRAERSTRPPTPASPPLATAPAHARGVPARGGRETRMAALSNSAARPRA